MKKLIFAGLILGVLFILAFPALALDPLVPCGGEGQPLCTTCDFLVLGKNISDFILIYLVPAIASLLFIYAGFEILLGGGIPARVQQGRNVFQTTVYGLVVIFLAWLIVNTILHTVAGDENIAQNWWKLECRESVSTEVASDTNNELPPNVDELPSNVDTNTNGTDNSGELPPNMDTSPSVSPLPSSSNSGALTCKFSGANLCQASGSCPTNACSQYSSAIQTAAASTLISGLNTAALIRAFMYNESSCNATAKSNSNPPSCGLMQLQADTANRFKSQCGISASITCDWLTNPANAEASICIAAKYIRSIAGGTCGADIRNIAAGYNGGVGACGNSNDCKSDKSCDGGTVRRWECLYDNPQYTVCNTGYDETRAYAPKVLACYNINK